MNLKEFLHKHSQLLNPQELIFYGGSFSPWHKGHEECVKLTSQFGPVIVIPDHNPFKVVNDKKLSQEIRDYCSGKDQVYLFEGFYNLKEKNPTSAWIQDFKKNFPLHKISFAIGYDSFRSIHTWIDHEKLINNIETLYVISRLEQDEDHQLDSKIILSINPSIKIQFLGHHPFEKVSSTKLRDKKA